MKRIQLAYWIYITALYTKKAPDDVHCDDDPSSLESILFVSKENFQFDRTGMTAVSLEIGHLTYQSFNHINRFLVLFAT